MQRTDLRQLGQVGSVQSLAVTALGITLRLLLGAIEDVPHVGPFINLGGLINSGFL